MKLLEMKLPHAKELERKKLKAEMLVRRAMVAELQESERRFRVVANSTPLMIWMSGPDSLFEFFNQSWLEFTGRTPDQEIGNGWLDSIHPTDLRRWLREYRHAWQSRQKFNIEYRLRHADGAYRRVLSTGVPRYSGDQFAGYIGSCVVIA